MATADTSDSSDDDMLCPNADDFTELFRKCRNGGFNFYNVAAAAGSNESTDDITVEDNPSPSCDDKQNLGEGPEKEKVQTSVLNNVKDIHDLTTDEENENMDSDIEELFKEYKQFSMACNKAPPKVTSNQRQEAEGGETVSRSAKAVTNGKPPPKNAAGSKKNTTSATVANPSTSQVSVQSVNQTYQTFSSGPGCPMIVVDILETSINDHPKVPLFSNDKPYHQEEGVQIIDHDEEINFKFKVSVRVRYQGKLHRFKAYETDEVREVKKLLSEATGGTVSPKDFLFYKPEPDNEFPVEDWITVQESGIEYNIFEALRTTKSSNAPAVGQRDPRESDPNFVKLSLQTGQRRSKPVVIFMRKTEPLVSLPERYIDQAGLNGRYTFDQIKFMFDGEPLNLKATPESLDMEDECIDVFFK